jgi:hypothetical protein
MPFVPAYLSSLFAFEQTQSGVEGKKQVINA